MMTIIIVAVVLTSLMLLFGFLLKVTFDVINSIGMIVHVLFTGFLNIFFTVVIIAITAKIAVRFYKMFYKKEKVRK